jgi:hypothetical protein
MSQTDYSKLVLGLLVVLIVVAFPRGIIGTLGGLLDRVPRPARRALGRPVPGAAE